MIAPLLLAATLAAAPEAAPDAGAPATFETKVTLELKGASVKDTLEKIAFLLDATPIFEPGIEGTLTLSATDKPIGELLTFIEKAANVRVALDVKGRAEVGKPDLVQRRLVVTRGEREAPPENDAALDRELFANPALPRRAKGEKPDPGLRSDVFEFRSAGGVAATWKLPFAGIASVDIPGCAAPVRLAVLWASDRVRVAVPGSGAGSRIERPGNAARKESSRRIALPGCRETFTMTQLADDANVVARSARRDATPRDQFTITPIVLEVTSAAEKVVTAPKVQAMTGGMFSLSSRARTGAIAGTSFLYEGASIWGTVFERTATDVLLALSTAVDREIEPAPGEPVVVVRRAESDQLLRVPLGEKQRVTLSPTYGAGGSTLVMDLTITPMERRAE